MLAGVEYAEDVEVVRCESLDDAPAIFQIGVRFLWTSPRHQGSIRHAVLSHAAALNIPDVARLM